MAAGKYAFGVDSDQALSLPEYATAIITSSQKVIDVAVLDLIKKNAGGDLGGEDYVGTLANNGVRWRRSTTSTARSRRRPRPRSIR